MDTEDNMAVKNGITSQGSVCCPRDLSGSGDELLHLNGALAVDAAARAEELPADETTRHTDSCCLHREAPGSARPLADGQVCKNTGLGCSPGRNSLLSEQADAPVGTDDPASSAAVPEIHTEGIAGVSDDFSDDDLEYFECSDVLTAQEDEIWQKRLRFLLESDDEDDLKLSQDCDGCALLLGEVSGDTAPVETPIGFRGHHSTFPGLGVRTDPSVSSQSPLQADMTLAVGHHRPRGPGPRDAAPVASADERPSSQEETDASGHLAAAGRARHTAPDPAAVGAVPSAGGTGAAGTVTGAGTARVAREEGDRDVPRENPQHTGCAFTETLRRNLFKLFNPLELCRYVSTIGQSLQAAAEGRESTAPSASREGVLIPEETESLEVQAREEDEDEDCQWGGKRTQGLPEQNQMPDENVPLGDQGADLISVSQNCENLGVEPQTEGTLGAWEGGGSSQPSAGMLCADITLPADNADLQTPSLTWGQRESCPQEIINHGSRSEEGMSAFPSGGAGSVPDNQECLCAVLPSAKLCAEPGEGEQSSGFHRGDGSDTDLPCSPSGGADPLPALGSACRGDADVSAVHDKLWKLLHEDDSECHIPFADRGVTSLGMRLTDVQLTEQETCCHPPVLMDVREEQEPLPAPGPECRDHLTEQEPLPAPSPECRDHLTEQEPLPAPGPECRDHLTEQEPLPAPSPECRDHLTEQEPLPAPSPECRDHLTEQEPLPAPGPECRDHLTEQEPLPAPGPECRDHLTEQEPLPAPTHLTLPGAAAPTACLARVVGEDGAGNGMEARAVGADGAGNGMEARAVGADGAGNGMEAPAVCPSANSTLLRPGLHPGHGMSWVNDSVPGEGCSFRGGLADCPEEKGIFPSDNTYQLTRAGHSSVNTMPGSDELNLQAEGDHSDSNAQNNTNSQSCHLPKINSCQDFQVVPAALKHGSEMQLPALTEPPAAITHKDLPQNAEQLPETAKQEGAFTSSSRDLLLSDFCLEVASCEAAKPGGEQSEIHTADGHRAETSPDPGVTQVSEGQSAVSPHYKAEPQGRGDQSDTQQLPGTATLLLLTPASHSEGLLPSSSAVACPGTGIQVKTGSTPAGDEGNRNLSVLEAPCRASQGLLHRAPAETRGEGAWCGNEHGSPRAVGHMIKTKAALISSQAQGQEVNSGTEQSCPDRVPPSEADYSISNKEEEVRAAESGVNGGLVHFPPADSGSKGCLEEQTPCSRTRPFPSTSCDPFAIDAERQRNQEGSRSCQAEPEPPRCKQDAAKAGHSAAGAKKKLPPAALPKKPRLEEKGGGKKSGKGEAGVTRRDDRKSEQRKLGLKKDSKAPRLLKKIQAESVPEGSGNVRLCCQFGDIHGDSTVTWTKDSRVLARLQRSAQDDSPVSLEIAKATPKAQGMYYCCLNNTYGKVTAEFHLTAAVLERLSSSGSYEGVEEIEFMQLLFREDSISDSYFGGHLHGVLATEQLHFGEGMHRRAFRSRVRRGLAPVFAPGHACVLKVHSALSPASGTREELVRRNYNLALQECCVQNAAREYAKLYAAEAETLEGFGEVPEIIPIFLIHRPANTIPYATVEEELVGDFVKYSVRDGKEVNFLRRDSEAGQKCCTFQHWVYERTSGNLLVTDLQGVGMKLTDVGIATLAKGYKGFKGNCSFSFIEQFRALHQCNEYCEMLGLKSLRAAHQKQRKATAPKGKTLPSSAAAKKMMPKKGREHRDFISSEH